MSENLTLRAARSSEYQWINDRYDEVGFVHSRTGHDLVLIAEVGGQPAGIGRLVRIAPQSAELGGMLVFENFRGGGIAHRLVAALLELAESASQFQTIYCLPFAHLAAFYRQHGFTDVAEPGLVPAELRAKHQWCNTTYSDRTTLLLERRP